MAFRYNPPPNWPQPPAGWTPPPGWQPDPAWGPAPEGWQVWVEDSDMNGASPAPTTGRAQGSWFARHKVLTGLVAVLLLFFVIGALSGGDETQTDVAQPAPTGEAEPSTETEEATAPPVAQEEPAPSAAVEPTELPAPPVNEEPGGVVEDFTCDDLIPEVISISEEQAGEFTPAILQIYDAAVSADRIDDYNSGSLAIPEGQNRVEVFTCSGTAAFDDGTEEPISFSVQVDSNDDLYVFYEPVAE